MANSILPNDAFGGMPIPIPQRQPYVVYVKTNSNGYITAINSSAFLGDTTGYVEIDSGYGDRYHHAQGNYFPEPIFTAGGAYRYKLVGGKAAECMEEEIKAQLTAMQPSTPTAQEDTDAMLVDHEYRLTLLELGVTE